MKNFNWKNYIANYPDLRNAGISTKYQALKHYLTSGKNENRTDKKEGKDGKNIGIFINDFKFGENNTKLTIITPSCRPDNLKYLMDSIDFNYINEWIIVYDANKVLNFKKQFNNPKINEYFYKFDGPCVAGHPLRNYGLSQIKNQDTFVYFLDDDNIIHQDLYKLLNVVKKDFFYTFNQINGPMHFGNNINIDCIDTAMFLIDYNLIKNIKWKDNIYHADGIFIMDIFNLNPDKWIYANNINCYYNFLN
jgi:hypothetical protein